MPVTIDLARQNALVTGGTRGIGRAISLRLAEAGARVAMIYRADDAAAREAEVLLAAAADRGHFALRADIAHEDQARTATSEAIERLGGTLHALVLDAAAGGAGPVAEAAPADWRRPFDVNVHGHVWVCQEALAALQPGAGVVFISSGAGHDPIPGLGAYGASKAAVNHLAAILAQEWGPRGIRVNVVSPGHTAMQPVDYGSLSEKERATVESTALRRMGTPEDVADAVLLLVSKLAGFVTGQFLRVNGGRV